MNLFRSKNCGFTLLELIIGIAIIGVLSASAFVAVDPAKRLGDSRDARRYSDLSSILQANLTYQVDLEGNFPVGIDETLRMIGTDSSGCDVHCGGGESEPSAEEVIPGEIFANTAADWNAGTYDNTSQSSGQVQLPSGGSGSYTSPIYVLDGEVDWQTLSWGSVAPYGKPLPDQQASESAYALHNQSMEENVALYHFDDLSGDILETSGVTSDGIYNGALYSQDGVLGSALGFDGVDDVMQLPNSDEINLQDHAERTISVWFKADDVSIASRKQVIYEEGGRTRGLNIYLYDGKLYVGGWNAPVSESGWEGTYLSHSSIQSGQWHHVMLRLHGGTVFGPGSLWVYLDGRNIGSGWGSQVWAHGADNGVGAMLGDTRFHDGEATGDGHWFAGQIDELAIFNDALDPLLLQGMYQRGAYDLELSVRVCDDPLCSGESFQGLYSEEENFSIALPQFSISDLSASRYVQFRVEFSSMKPFEGPALDWVRLNYDRTVSSSDSSDLTDESCLDLSVALSNYLPEIPHDPQMGDGAKSYYAVQLTPEGALRVVACESERRESIELIR